MPERLTSADAAFLQAEESGTPQHVGTLSVLHDPAGGLDHAELAGRVRRHLDATPRYRQLVRRVPGRIAHPVWVDDANFDLGHHVRRSMLPRPGEDEQLRELVARLMSRPLDQSRPLWELYLVEGMSGSRVALLSKSHHALVDGVGTMDIGQLVLGPGGAADGVPHGWRATGGPSSVGLIVEALVDAARQPAHVVDAVRHSVTDVRSTAGRLASAAAGAAAAARTMVLPPPASPLRSRPGGQRLFATVDTPLADYRLVRSAHGGSINDVVLATVTGALRSWLHTRGEIVAPAATVRAVVPVSVRDDQASLVSSYLVDLPVGEPAAVRRLREIGYATQTHKDTGVAVDAGSLVRMAGFAPPTLHALGARVASALTQRSSHLVVTNVPGPQTTIHVAGARLLRSYPVMPLPPGQALSFGITSYDGTLSYGLYADRDAMADVDVMAHCISESLAELVDASR